MAISTKWQQDPNRLVTVGELYAVTGKAGTAFYLTAATAHAAAGDLQQVVPMRASTGAQLVLETFTPDEAQLFANSVKPAVDRLANEAKYQMGASDEEVALGLKRLEKSNPLTIAGVVEAIPELMASMGWWLGR